MLTNKFAFYDINYGEFASITGTNLNTSTAVYAYDNRSDAGNVTWNTTTGSFTYDFGQSVQLDSFFINNHNWQTGEIGIYDDRTVFLYHAEAANSSTVFVDDSVYGVNSPHTGTAGAGIYISTDQAKFGSSSIAFGVGGNDLSFASSNDFALENDSGYQFEFNYYPTSLTNLGIVQLGSDLSLEYLGGINHNWTLIINGASTTVTGTKTLTTGTWQHVAVSKDTLGIGRIFIDGMVAAIGSLPAMATSSTTLSIGNGIWGYIDEVKISKRCVYNAGALSTTAFTPPIAAFSTTTYSTITTFSNLTTNAYYYNSTLTLPVVKVKYSFTTTQDSLTGTAGEIIATKKKFSLSRNPSKYIPSKTPILKTNRLYNGPIVSTRVGDHFDAQIGWNMLLGDPNTMTNTDLQLVTELAKTNVSFLFWPNAGNSFVNLHTWRLEDVFKCKITDPVTYEFADPDCRSIIADYLIQEVK